MITRRRLIAGAGGLAAMAVAGRVAPSRAGRDPAFAETLGPAAVPEGRATVALDLVAAERPTALPCFGGRTLPLWTFSDADPLPVVRMRLGDRLVTRLQNRLPRAGEHTSIHWHGIRLPNREDGVPYLTQPPTVVGESHTYDFVPPDTGSFFFHTHCNTVEQLGRGLAGLLIVEGDETEPYDGEVVLAVRDWRIGADGGFLPFLTDRGASAAGSFGTVRSTNGADVAAATVPAGADVRVRVYNLDASRVMAVGVEGAEAAVVAVDGIAVPPFPLTSWVMGPAMRLDLVVRTPADGGVATVVDWRPATPKTLATLTAAGERKRLTAFSPAPLRRAAIAVPDLLAAERLTFALSTTATGQAVGAALAAAGGMEGGVGGLPGPDDLCLSDRTFWAINKAAWPADGHNRLPPPLAVLRRGGSYVVELVNTTRHIHPIHIHGHTFTVIGSNDRPLPVHHADTVLVYPKERVEVAFVADNPGDWMVHCHLIEHQETGMMGYLRVA
ncbi:multicopper oxidase family protein [Mongoliimonas terrestris]|uniref:multicopper oxidase family protein n=1 Tax=Mongoliimonas terrestris TaxID=1709001 RepID=UPI000949A12F|nr:multicopper oxidase family protein [Mongoliimonas terrestris]